MDISIIIPAYNVESYIAAAVRSALDQRFVSFEVILVDDGSTDQTLDRLAAFKDDSRVSVIHQTNQGPSAARNRGIEVAKGRYIGFLDGDDLWDADKAYHHVTMLDKNPQLDVTYNWWRVIDENGRPAARTGGKRPISDLPFSASFESLLVENFVGYHCVCRRDVLQAVGGFDATLRRNEDLELLLRLTALRDGNIGLVPKVLSSYRAHSSQSTRNWRGMMQDWSVVLDRARSIAPERVERVETLARARQYRYIAFLAYSNGDKKAARQLIARAWKGAPRSMLRSRRDWLVTAAIATSLLPESAHDWLANKARAWRLRGVTRAPSS